MTESRQERFDRLLDQLLEMPADERSAFLDRECGDELELRRELEEHAREIDDDFLEPPPLNRDEVPKHQVGEFELLRELGRGGMGAVYLARHAMIPRLVAVKVMVETVATTSAQVQRFKHEAESIGKLRHEHIVSVHSRGEANTTHWFAMDYIEGHDLQVELRLHQKPLTGSKNALLPPPKTPGHMQAIVSLVADVAEALQYAHDQKIVHRDIKPTNLLLDRSGHVYVCDFGLARDESLGSITKSGEAQGTVDYMSPEQVVAKRADVDHRTDIYSLGVVLYEALSLKRPFRAETQAAVMLRIRDHNPESVRKANSRVPRDLETICHTAMAFDRNHRYKTAADFAEDLRRFLRFESIMARPPSIRRRFTLAVRRNRIAATALATSIVISSFAFWWHAANANSRIRENHLKRAQVLIDAASFGSLRLDQMIQGRRGCEDLESSGYAEDEELIRTVNRRLTEYRDEELEEANKQLAIATSATATATSEGDSRQIFEAISTLSRLSAIFPEDRDLARKVPAHPTSPRISVTARTTDGAAIGGFVSIRLLDPITGIPGAEIELGELPLDQIMVNEPGQYRVSLNLRGVNGRREFTRYLFRGRWDHRLDAVIYPRPPTTRMIPIDPGNLELNDLRIAPPNGLQGKSIPIEAFEIEEHEVTNAQYRSFLKETGHPEPKHWNLVTSDYDDLPVVNVSWIDARTYAEWAGKRLPSLAEWSMATRGPEGRRFPWRETEPGRYFGNCMTRMLSFPTPEERLQHALESLVPARSDPESQTENGLFHALGNVWEWTETVGTDMPSSGVPVAIPDRRFIVGGAWDVGLRREGLETLIISFAAESRVSPQYGIRCARSL